MVDASYYSSHKEEESIIYCERCKKKLIRFRVTCDWNKRKLHKTCWKKEMEEFQFQEWVKMMEKSNKYQHQSV